MISRLRGKLLRCSPTELTIDVNGVGYDVSIPLSTFEQMGKIDGEVAILTYLHVREDTMQLFGFATEPERDLFRLLISISGIGPRMAQTILSGLKPHEFREAILQGNIAALTAISGVGKKTAERLVIELRDKMGKADFAGTIPIPGSVDLKSRTEVIVALMSLGFTRQGAERTIQDILTRSGGKELSIEDLIKLALRSSTR